MMKKPLILALILCLAVPVADAAVKRSAKAKYDFRKEHICPAPGGTRFGRCDGYVIDHIRPLCAGGADAPHNMQWQTVADAKAKDRLERRECAALRKQRAN